MHHAVPSSIIDEGDSSKFLEMETRQLGKLNKWHVLASKRIMQNTPNN